MSAKIPVVPPCSNCNKTLVILWMCRKCFPETAFMCEKDCRTRKALDWLCRRCDL